MNEMETKALISERQSQARLEEQLFSNLSALIHYMVEFTAISEIG